MSRSRSIVRMWVGVLGLLLPAVAQAQLFTPNAGVRIDPQGVLRTQTINDSDGALGRELARAARSNLDPQLARRSVQRKVSLNRLEQAIAACLESRRVPTDEMRYLAGLTRIQYVFYYPDSGDVVIAGPAEGFMTDAQGHVVGIESGRPVLELQDLVVALRAYPPGGKPAPTVGCSIDATQEGLAKMQQFLNSVAGSDPRAPGFAEQVATGLRESLGLQQVRVEGVPADTHFAQVMVEADYRMKLIGIGLEVPPVRITSYVDLANPATVAANAMQRWWFVPDYRCVRATADGLAMQLEGNGVKLLGENELVAADGSRQGTGGASRASQAFTTGFTQKYPQLAEKHPVYAQLRNLIDMLIAAAFIQEQDYYGQSGWRMEVFGSEERLPVQGPATPSQVETAVNAKWKGNRLMTPVGGGVTIDARQALAKDNRLSDDDGKVGAVRASTKVEGLADGQWWWD